ncbi:MAG: RluA family pseudouridine synthase [Butyrivibrio sp.]|nr:RluA family pseudouridine synthase [Butyrivibrio sp.]
MKEIVVGKNEEGKRFDSFLKSYLKEASSGFIYKMLRKKNITLNDKKSDGKDKLNAGDSIKIFFSDETLNKMRGSGSNDIFYNPAKVLPREEQNSNFHEHRATISNLDDFFNIDEFPVIYEDENIVLADKPVGMLTQKAAPCDFSLNDWLIHYLLKKGDVTSSSLETYRPSVCNRLDRNTSGLVICAKTLTGARKMNELIRDRSVSKYYRTIVGGKLTESMKLKGYLCKDEKKNIVTIRQDAKGASGFSYIETEYVPVNYIPQKNLTMLEVKLITGKPHQIRAHLSSIGHPVAGDIKYGGQRLKGINHQLLHSYRLIFPSDMEAPFNHLSGREFNAPLPKAFTDICSK